MIGQVNKSMHMVWHDDEAVQNYRGKALGQASGGINAMLSQRGQLDACRPSPFGDMAKQAFALMGAEGDEVECRARIVPFFEPSFSIGSRHITMIAPMIMSLSSNLCRYCASCPFCL